MQRSRCTFTYKLDMCQELSLLECVVLLKLYLMVVLEKTSYTRKEAGDDSYLWKDS